MYFPCFAKDYRSRTSIVITLAERYIQTFISRNGSAVASFMNKPMGANKFNFYSNLSKWNKRAFRARSTLQDAQYFLSRGLFSIWREINSTTRETQVRETRISHASVNDARGVSQIFLTIDAFQRSVFRTSALLSFGLNDERQETSDNARSARAMRRKRWAKKRGFKVEVKEIGWSVWFRITI